MPARPSLFPPILLIAILLAAGLLLASTPDQSAAAAQAAGTGSRIEWNDRRWFLQGTNLPWIRKGCDFGCRGNGGVLQTRAAVDRRFAALSRGGTKVVRWYLFPGDAWQVRRGTGDSPAGLRRTAVFADMDAAHELARRHDISLVFVLFEDPRAIPASWMLDPTQRTSLASALAPMFRRYGTSRNVLAWELFNEPERALDDPTSGIGLADLRATVAQLAAAVHANSRAHATIGPVSVDRVGLWTQLGLDFYAPHQFPPMVGTSACASCRAYEEVAAAHGVDRPIVMGAFASNNARQDLRQLRSAGYAGAIFWSARTIEHPSFPGQRPPVPLGVTNEFMYAHGDVGPRSRPLNPCLGPAARELRCPDLRMSRPSELLVHRVGRRTLLLSRNSLNSYGLGPAELHGRRSGVRTMNAVQRIWRRGGGKLAVDTGARLYFKFIPKQGGYWKWRNAATFELWQLDGAGKPVRLMREGPKTIYCLRDLKRTRGRLRGSPKEMFYPACNKNPARRRVTLGTSVGWSDIYPARYFENWIDVTGLRGCYAYVHIADPTNVMYELDEENNRSAVTVRLPWRGSSRGCPNAQDVAAGAPGGY